MSPPGKRRASSPTFTRFATLLFLFLCFLSPTVLAANGVLGIDVGTEYIKAALVKPGIPLEIVLTKDSKRKETSAIAFKSSPQDATSEGQFPERLYGGDALALAPRIPSDVYPNLKHLLGKLPLGILETYKSRYPALDLVEHENGTVAFVSKSFSPGAYGTFSVEELLAMELKSIRGNAEQMAGSDVKDAVITIPPFWSADERRAMEFAAELAGIRVIGLVSDGMAVGLNYATSRTFGNVDEGEEPEYHLVYDMGAGSTKATLLRMQGRRVKDVGKLNKTIQEIATVSVGYDKDLGGDALNDLIVNDMVEKFIGTSDAKKAGLEAATVRNHGRTMAKLWRESERLRQVLSANMATSAFFESLYEDVDFRYKLSRTEFETMASALSERVSRPLYDALDGAGMKFEDITSIILHGGAVRTPFVQSTLEAIAGGPAKLKSNVNADEAAVFGAAFKAASLSPSFKVKEIRDLDIAMYPITLQWTSNGKERRQQIFVAASQAGPIKQMPMKTLDDFSISFSQKLPHVATEQSILEVQTNNLTKSVGELMSNYGCVRENMSTVVSMRLGQVNALPEVTRVTVTCEVMESEKKEGILDGVKGMFGFGKKDDQKSLSDEDDEAELLEPISESSSEATTSRSSTASESAASSSAGAKDTKPVKKTHVVNISITSKPTGRLLPTDLVLMRIKDSLVAFDMSDKGRRLREELYNGLEGFTYRVRDMLTDTSFMGVSTSAQRDTIENALSSTNAWLHSEGSLAGMDAIKEKLQDLKSLVDPVQQRKEEQKRRPIALQKLQDTLKKASTLRNSVSEQIAYAASAASLSAAEASSTALSAVPSATDAAASDASSALNDEAENEDDATPVASSLLAKLSSYIDPSAYTDADLSRITSAFDSTTEWLTESLAKQEGLQISDEPALLSTDLDSMTIGLKKVIEELQRKRKAYESNKSRASSSSKKASKTKSKSSASSKTTATSAGAEQEAENMTGSAPGTEEPSDAKTKHDEL